MAKRQRGLAYAEREVRPVAVEGAVAVDKPEEGYFQFRLHRGAVFSGVRIWYGPPNDPVTGEELDRSWRWQAEMNGEPIDFERVWPVCAGDPITAAQYRKFIATQAWARKNAPDSAYAERGRRHDLLSISEPLPF